MYHSITFTTDPNYETDPIIDKGSFNPTSVKKTYEGEERMYLLNYPLSENTWEDWHLIPSSRPQIAMPPFSEKYLEIPGRDGSIDLSEWLTGRVTYGDRTGSLEFYHQNGYEDIETIRHAMAQYFHGRVVKMILEDDPGYYYEGRFKVSQPQADGNFHKITIDYRVGPYKWTTQKYSLESLPWDVYSLEHDRDYHFTDKAPVADGDIMRFWEIPESQYADVYATPNVTKVSSGSVGNRTFHGFATVKGEAVFSTTGTWTIGNQKINITEALKNYKHQGFPSSISDKSSREIPVSYTGTVAAMFFWGGQL